MEPLYGPIRDYAWGSRSAIALLQGRPVPSAGPEAELWLGAHPGGPATVDRAGLRVSLCDLVRDEPGQWLGQQVSERFGGRLPFLLKVLAADAPLSLQAHPDAEQARAGYEAEAGLPAEQRNYSDPHHKPELLVALTPFEALCGFRDPGESAEALAAFGVPELAPVVAALRDGPAGLATAVRTLLNWPVARRHELLGAVVSASADSPDAELAHRLAKAYPGDPGVLVALLLHHVRLVPGEGIWMPAGNLHAYLSGCGVEIMAASDNVLRGGLTPKRVDVDELLRVLRFEVLDEPVRAAQPVGPGVDWWPVPVDDFALHRVRVDAALPSVTLPLPGPRVVLCAEGSITVDDGAGALTLVSGEAAIGTAAGEPLRIGGAGVAYVATSGLR
ncbi:mannose-6-phosphate isomerase, class I [Micromonospora sp. WMMD1120]|uniref:mannose-6-phosphate isomerase, class I n=1 Tax=Micromonospora sp. WMMD1120 TaxID=3016106 RepID=UPI002416A141|nr:mannose-6-phosphate isomerase, class I [Micromonospora sp. WMMD1120]MDG4808017.1 mannose-6-phosphate isomerase, class I [Micromonospora sp. WMMD1120]